MNLNWKASEVKEGTFEANLNVKIVSLPSETIMTNSNDTEYQVLTVELEDGKQATAIMYRKNVLKGLEQGSVKVGNKVACKAIYNPDFGEEVLLQASHLVAGERIKASALGFVLPTAATAATDKKEFVDNPLA